MSGDNEADLDFICTVAGLVIVLALAAYLIIVSTNGGQIGWKVPAVVGGIGIVLMLPFGQLMRLVKAGGDLVPWGESDG